jgi:hypothetical protein
MGDAIGRPSWRSSLLSDSGAKVFDKNQAGGKIRGKPERAGHAMDRSARIDRRFSNTAHEWRVSDGCGPRMIWCAEGSDEVEIIRHAHQLPVDRMQGEKESAVRHGPKDVVKGWRQSVLAGSPPYKPQGQQRGNCNSRIPSTHIP